MSGKDDFWNSTFSKIHEKVGDSVFELWFKPMKLLHLKDKTTTIEIPNRFFKDWVEDNYPNLISEAMEAELGHQVAVKFRIGAKEDDVLKKMDSKNESRRTRLANRGIYLNPKYTFDTFVVGSSNQFANAAAKRICEGPGSIYNPLFIYGGVGLGKTHLINAIGNVIVDKFPSKVIYYVSAEQFTNEVISSIRHEKMGEFKDKYRNADILLVDDIQFIAGKTATQEEFFHTFNTLHGQNKQIIVSSDRPPKDIPGLLERLRSRFEWGLTADIQLPDLETRLAILGSKAERLGRTVPAEIMELIARRVQSNIRELEGALNRIVAFADLSGMAMTQQLADVALADLLPQRGDVKPGAVVDMVAKTFNLSVERLLSPDRSHDVALPRQIAMYLMRETNVSLPQIGQALGGRDHTTVMYACEKVADLLERDDRLRTQVGQIRRLLYA